MNEKHHDLHHTDDTQTFEDPCTLFRTGRARERETLFFEQIQRTAGIGVWTLNVQEERLEWSAEVFRIFEIDPRGCVPTYELFIRTVHPDDRDAVNKAYLASLENSTPYLIEHRLLMPDGRIKHVREACTTCYDEAREPVASYGTVQDITALKRQEEEIIAQSKMLLHRSRLAQMGEMIDSIAHQWKQPLHQINSILPALEMHYKDHTLTAEELASRLDEIEMLTTHMSQTVDSFRHFIHPGKEDATFNLNDAIRDTLMLLQGELKRQGVGYEFLAESSFTCDGNKEEFMQALLTILGNALECFRHRGITAPELRIEAGRSSTDITIKISDNAGGIPDHFVNKVFDLYFTTKINGHGTGLGLYIAKMLIEKSMHGTITAENGKRGAVFTIFLPYEERLG